MNLKVIIADSHPIVRLSLRSVLKDSGYTVIGEVSDAEATLSLCDELLPSLLIIDVAQPALNGLHLIKQLKLRRRPMKILVFTGQESNPVTVRCMAEGAHGLVHKHEETSTLIDAIRTVTSGYMFFPVRKDVSPSQPYDTEQDEKLLSTLSSRELTVLQRLSWGQTQKSIAQTMYLSDKTISTYKSRLLFKLQARNSIQLYEIAKRNGLA